MLDSVMLKAISLKHLIKVNKIIEDGGLLPKISWMIETFTQVSPPTGKYPNNT